jgi:hypothetical protein
MFFCKSLYVGSIFEVFLFAGGKLINIAHITWNALFEDQTVLFVDSNLRTILPRLGN